MFERGERLASASLLLILIGLPVAVLGYQFGLRPALAGVRTVDVVAAAPEAGGFQPDQIVVRKGETVRLRFSVPDVTHGVAIAGLGVDLGQIDPGQVKEVEVVFDQPGVVTYYCNTWCSPNHWRMRGTITVIDPADPGAHLRAGPGPDPVIESLIGRGVDVDAHHEAELVPTGQPSAAAGRVLSQQRLAELPPELFEPVWLQQHSPEEAFFRLRESVHDLTDEQRWDVVAYLWTGPITGDDLLWAQTEFGKNCAACHGVAGGGDGPAAAAINAQLESSEMAHVPRQVASFGLSAATMGATTEIYYAKLRRGGMGTSMPSFGPIFSEEETWQLARYLWWLTFAGSAQD